MRAKRRLTGAILTAAALIISAVHISPIVVMVLNSLRTNDEVYLKTVGLPVIPQFENYAVAWSKGQYGQAYLNNLAIGLTVAFIVLLCTGLAAYGVNKLRIYGNAFFSNYFVAGLAIPSFAIIVPLFFFFNKVGLTNSRAGMVIIYSAINLPFNFMFVNAFFKNMPKELDEAARIDGATELQNFLYNIIPMAMPIFSSVLLIVFVNVWNEFMFANIFLQDETMRTVSLRIYTFIGKTGGDFAYVYAAAVISILPILVIYLLMQNTFIEGMTAGSVKG